MGDGRLLEARGSAEAEARSRGELFDQVQQLIITLNTFRSSLDNIAGAPTSTSCEKVDDEFDALLQEDAAGGLKTGQRASLDGDGSCKLATADDSIFDDL